MVMFSSTSWKTPSSGGMLIVLPGRSGLTLLFSPDQIRVWKSFRWNLLAMFQRVALLTVYRTTEARDSAGRIVNGLFSR